MRKGRFDEIFFVGLPGFDVRTEIFAMFDLPALASASAGFSGAEIKLVVAAVYGAHGETRSLENGDVLAILARTRPLSTLMAERVETLLRPVLADLDDQAPPH